MKVLFLNNDNNPRTGAGRFLIDLSRALHQPSADFTSQALVYGDPLFPSKYILLVYWIFGFGKKIGTLVSGCDIIHALDGWPYGFWAALLAKKYHKKLVITAVGTGGVKPLYNFWQRTLLLWAYGRADRIVAVSRHTRDEILKIAPNLKIEVINHGVDAGKFQSSDVSRLASVAKPYILSVGAWKKRKGLEVSIESFRLAKKNIPELRYVILSRPGEAAMKQYPDVEFVSGLSDEQLIELYKNAELFILLPQDDKKDIEGFGLVYLEAAAAGLPVIGGRSTSAEDAILDRKNGFLVTGPEEAADKITEILKTPGLREQMSKASSELAKSMTWRKAGEEYSAIYKKLLSL